MGHPNDSNPETVKHKSFSRILISKAAKDGPMKSCEGGGIGFNYSPGFLTLTLGNTRHYSPGLGFRVASGFLNPEPQVLPRV